MNSFNTWLDTFVAEKNLDPEELLTVKGDNNTHIMPAYMVLDGLKRSDSKVQASARKHIVARDFTGTPATKIFEEVGNAIFELK